MRLFGLDYRLLAISIPSVPDELSQPWLLQANNKLVALGIAPAVPRDQDQQFHLIYLIRHFGELIINGRKVQQTTKAFLSL
jgi:hypothetical protein